MSSQVSAKAITSGFNTTEGYVDGVTVAETPNTDPGWHGSTWVISSGGSFPQSPALGVSDQSAPPSPDGGLALHLITGSAGETWAFRSWGHQLAPQILIEQYIYLPEGGYMQSRPGAGGIGELIAAHWVAIAGSDFLVMDGLGDGSGPFEDTGIQVNPGEWYKVSTLIDQATQTYRFFVDDKEYLAPDPLNFRGGADPGFYIDRVDYLADSEGWLDGVKITTLVPEPSSIALFGIGMIAISIQSYHCRRSVSHE